MGRDRGERAAGSSGERSGAHADRAQWSGVRWTCVPCVRWTCVPRAARLAQGGVGRWWWVAVGLADPFCFEKRFSLRVFAWDEL